MKIYELADNWECVRDSVITKHPYICCCLVGRGVEIDGNVVRLKYKPEEFMFQKIAHRFAGGIYEGIKDYVDDNFKLEITIDEAEEQ